MIDSIRILIPSLPSSGDHNYWKPHTEDQAKCEDMIGNLGIKSYLRHNCRCNTRQQNQQNHNQSNAPLPRKHNKTNDNAPIHTIRSKNHASRILGLTPQATTREVTLKYRVLARKYYPDK